MTQFCERQPDACAVGSQVAVALGQRAQAGAKMLYEFLNERLGPHETGSVTTTAAGKAVPLPPAQPSQNTLTPTDLVAALARPQPQREARRDRSDLWHDPPICDVRTSHGFPIAGLGRRRAGHSSSLAAIAKTYLRPYISAMSDAMIHGRARHA